MTDTRDGWPRQQPPEIEFSGIRKLQLRIAYSVTRATVALETGI